MASILYALWGRRLVILAAFFACLLGGIIVIVVSAPRYVATARVVLDYVRPNPDTGVVVPSKMLDVYINSQIRLIRDYDVAGPAVEALGWLDDRDIQAAYASVATGATGDIRTWLASQIIASTNARMVEDSNILEISYVGQDPALAEAVVEALRQAYIQSPINAQAESSRAVADQLANDVNRMTIELNEIQKQKGEIEAKSGIMIQANGRDEASARLRSIVRAPPLPVLVRQGAPTMTSVLLQRVERQLSVAVASLGPNNPQLLALRSRRDMLLSQLRTEQSDQVAKVSTFEDLNRADTVALEQQKSIVLASRLPATEIRLLQDEIDRRVQRSNDVRTTIMQSRAKATATASSFSAMGPAEAKKEPVFPNKMLILGGSGGLGLTLGLLLAGVVELMARRIRSARDLEQIVEAPVLAVVPIAPLRPSRSSHHRAKAIFPKLDPVEV